MTTTGHIFGRTKDLLVFPLTTGLAILLGLAIPPNTFGLELISFVIFSETHIYTTFFFTFGSERQLGERGLQLFAILAVSIISIGFLWFQFGQGIAFKFFVLATIFHSARQQAAWFFISSAKIGYVSRLECIVDSVGIHGAIWGPVIVYLTLDERLSWFNGEDEIWNLPAILHGPALICAVLSAVIYFFYHFAQLILDPNRLRLWPKHVFWLNALVIWWVGVYFRRPFIVELAHSVPYIYLSLAYMRSRAVAGERFVWHGFSARGLVLYALFGSVAMAFLEWWTRDAIFTFWVGLAVAHYIIDGFFWRKKSNPIGRSFIDGLSHGPV